MRSDFFIILRCKGNLSKIVRFMSQFNNLTFYKCSENELEIITDLARRIWPDTFRSILTNDQLEYMLEWMYNPKHLRKQRENGHMFYLVKDNETEIGFVGLEPNFPSQSHLRIHKIYLLPSEQGKGIGKWMMDQVNEIGREKMLDFLHLNVNRFNRASGFYRKIGFQIIDEEDIDIGNGFFMNDFVMQKKL